MFSKVPKWVKDYPFELDKAALTSLAKVTKGRFDHPREMVYTLYGFRDSDAIENAISLIEQNGWQCSVLDEGDEPGSHLIECKKDDYVLNYENYDADTQFFMRVAQMYDAGYDGWHAGQ